MLQIPSIRISRQFINLA